MKNLGYNTCILLSMKGVLCSVKGKYKCRSSVTFSVKMILKNSFSPEILAENTKSYPIWPIGKCYHLS